MTKQFGNLKLHFSKRGIAYKWADGDVHRLSFGGDNSGRSAYSEESDPQRGGQQSGVYYQDNQAYDPSYDEDMGYAGDPSYDGTAAAPRSGSYEFLYRTDWVMWALLIVLPPLGIWILWQRKMFDPVIRAAISAASGIWFVLLLIWLFSSMLGGGNDPVTANVTPGGTVPPAVSTQTDAGDTQTGTNDGLDTTAPNTNQEVLTPVNNDPLTPSNPAGQSGGTGNTGNTGGTGNTGSSPTESSDEVWVTAVGTHYHKDSTCPSISGTPSPVTLAVAKSRGNTQCPTCFGTGTGGSGNTSGAQYWATKAGKYYHTEQNCSGMKGASKITLATAQKDGKKPCPTCIGTYYMTKNGKYYHTKATCSGMQNAQRVTKKRAVDSKKKPCPTCIGKKSTATTVRYYATKGGTYYHTKATCGGMKNAQRITMAQASQRKLKPCPTCVSNKKATTASYYSTTGGKYYHTKATCSGMKNAAKITLTTAKKRGQSACPLCVKTVKTTGTTAKAVYYATDPGKYYHSRSTCSGMKGAKKITLATAKKKGKTACPICLKSSAQKVKNNYVYTTTYGTYYHSRSNCSGMKGARKVTLAAAKKNGKKACPTCMKTSYYFTTQANRYYHAKSNCTGMKNATKITLASAKAKGKLACPVCVLKKASIADMNVSTFVVSGGRYYHKNKNCNGLKNAKKVTLGYAKGSGRTACPRCVKKTSSSNSTASADAKVKCYLLKSGTYYHSSRNCPKLKGKKNIVGTSVKTAKANDKRACPECVGTKLRTYVYVVPAGLLYHRSANCSGMRNPIKLTLRTALNRAYKRCTKCNAPNA